MIPKDVEVPELPYRPVESWMNYVAWVALIVLLLVGLVPYTNLPDQIPVHFDGAGKPDRMGPKATVLLMPGIGLAVFVLLGIAERKFRLFNVPYKVDQGNVERHLRLARMLLLWIKCFMLLLFAWITHRSVEISRERADGLGEYFTPLFLVLLLGPIVAYFIAAARVPKAAAAGGK